MVGFHGMAPAPIDLSDRIADPEERERGREATSMERFEKLGDAAHAPLGRRHDGRQRYAATLGDRDKRKLVAGLLGQALRGRLEHDPRQQGRHASTSPSG